MLETANEKWANISLQMFQNAFDRVMAIHSAQGIMPLIIRVKSQNCAFLGFLFDPSRLALYRKTTIKKSI